MMRPDTLDPIMWAFAFIWAVILLGLGTDSWDLIFALALIVTGVSVLLRGLFRSPQSI